MIAKFSSIHSDLTIHEIAKRLRMLPKLAALLALITCSQTLAQSSYPTPYSSPSYWPYPAADIVGHLTGIADGDFVPDFQYNSYYEPEKNIPKALALLSDDSWSTGVLDMWAQWQPDSQVRVLKGNLAGGPFYAGQHSIIIVGAQNTISHEYYQTVSARLVLDDGTVTGWKNLRTRYTNAKAPLSNYAWWGWGRIISDPNQVEGTLPVDGRPTWFSVTPLHLLVPDGKGVVGIELTKYMAGTGKGSEITFVGVIAHPRNSSIRISDSNRFGNASKGLPFATVKFIVNSGIVASAVTDANGYIDMTTMPEVKLSELYDVQVEKAYELQLPSGLTEKGTWKRVYQAVRPQDAVGGTVQLVLPVTLQENLATQLDKLKVTGTLSTDYDITRAKQLSAQRNRVFPETVVDHHSHDVGLARLLVAAESMSRIYSAVEPLAKDAGKVLADSIISILAMKEAASDVEANALASLLTSSTSERVKAYARATLSVWIKHSMTAQLKILVNSADQILPEWAADLVSQSNSDITTGILGAFVTSAWDKPGGRKQLLESLATLLSEQVGGRIIASAHVAQTQTDFDLAELRARQDAGQGEPSDSFKASQGKAIDIETAIDLALAESDLIGDTTAKFGQVADYADLAGKIPAAQIAGVMARMIKAINVGLTVRVVTKEMSTLYDVAFTDTPAAADLAFFPAGHTSPAPAWSPLLQEIQAVSEQAFLKASNVGAYDEFGTSVAISGDTIVVGVPGEDSAATGINGDQGNGATSSGAAYVFVRVGDVWTQQAYLKASNANALDVFGKSVAISGDTIVVGAPGEDSAATGVNGDQGNTTDYAGAAYVFVRNGDTWSQQAYLKASNTERNHSHPTTLA